MTFCALRLVCAASGLGRLYYGNANGPSGPGLRLPDTVPVYRDKADRDGRAQVVEISKHYNGIAWPDSMIAH